MSNDMGTDIVRSCLIQVGILLLSGVIVITGFILLFKYGL